jgi:hypothetical protein
MLANPKPVPTRAPYGRPDYTKLPKVSLKPEPLRLRDILRLGFRRLVFRPRI